MTKQGLDYGLGLANVDTETGIRFGVISQNSLSHEALEEFEAQYGEPTCPNCGNEAISNDREDCLTCAEMDILMLRKDYHCHGTRCAEANPTRFDGAEIPVYCFFSDMALGDDPIAHTYDGDGYHAHFGNDGFGVWIEHSPFYTYAKFCSPCAPGAGDLDSPVELPSYITNSPTLSDKAIAGYAEEEALRKVYCFGHDWFEDGQAPYRVFNVSDNTEIRS